MPFKGPKPVIGILGGIGSGKSQVAKAFQALGCGIVDADLLAAQARNSPDAINAMTTWWGPGILSPDGTPDRKAIAAKVFNNPGELARLEGLIHPLVFQARAQLVAKFNQDPGVPAIIEDCPLLLERNLEGPCDVLLYVDAPEQTRFHRVNTTRNWTFEEFRRRELLQMPLDMKRSRADYVVQNEQVSSDSFGLHSQVRQILQQVLRSQH